MAQIGLTPIEKTANLYFYGVFFLFRRSFRYFGPPIPWLWEGDLGRTCLNLSMSFLISSESLFLHFSQTFPCEIGTPQLSQKRPVSDLTKRRRFSRTKR